MYPTQRNLGKKKLKEARDTVLKKLSKRMEDEGVASDAHRIEDSFFTAYMDQVKVHRFAEENDTNSVDQYLTDLASREYLPSSTIVNQGKDCLTYLNVNPVDATKEGETTEKKLPIKNKFDDNERNFSVHEKDDTKESLDDITTSINLTREEGGTISVGITQKLDKTR